MARYTNYIATKIAKTSLLQSKLWRTKELDMNKNHLDVIRKGMFDVAYSEKGSTKNI